MVLLGEMQTIVLAPAAKLLVKVEGSCAVARFDVGQPFCDDIQEGGIEANGDADNCDHDPSLGILVCDPNLVSPVKLASFVETSGLFSAGLASYTFSGGILYPVCSLL